MTDDRPKRSLPPKYYTKAYEKKMAKVKAQTSGATCPNCSSTDTKRISRKEKVGKGVAFGLFAVNTLKSSWKCAHCGYRW